MQKVTIYSRFGRVMTVIVAILCAYVIGDSMLKGFISGMAVALPVLICVFVWLLFWSPKVVVSDEHVLILNPLRRIFLPWNSIDRVDTKYTLTLYTGNRNFQAWAAPAPSRFRIYGAHKIDGAHLPESTYVAGTIRPGDLITTDSGQVAYAIRLHLESIRDGHAEVLEEGPPKVSWRIPEMVTLIALTLISLSTVLF